jgi:hypothetical protein
MDTLLAECRFPELGEPYDEALREAVRFILANFDALGIIAAGSIVRGAGGPTSDLDVYVIQRQPQRQMIQRWFNGVPAQLFVNPPHMVERYFQTETAESGCSTAHMLATGFVVLERDPVVSQLRDRAKAILEHPPTVPQSQLNLERYGAADTFENALDKADEPEAAAMIAHLAVYRMLHYTFRKRGLFIPRDKDLLKRIQEQDAELGELVARFYRSGDAAEKLALAGEIADRTIETRGFFEWETPLEDV